MFERAAIFSALFVLVIFGIVGYKYYQFVETKNTPPVVQK